MAKLTVVAALLALIATGCGNDTVTVNEAPEGTETPTESTAPRNRDNYDGSTRSSCFCFGSSVGVHRVLSGPCGARTDEG